MPNINPIINLITSILSIYSFLLIIYVILYYLILFKVVNVHNGFVQGLNRFLIKIIEPVLSKIRRYVPPIGGVDISIIILFLAISFLKDVLFTYFYVY